MLVLTVNRFIVVGDATIGVLTINGKFECFTLEDVHREVKVYAKTRIPAGTYPLTLSYSNRFSKKYQGFGVGTGVPEVHGVKGFKHIRMHIGNCARESEGCILLGTKWKPAFGAYIKDSRTAYIALLKKLIATNGKMRLDVKDPVQGGPRQSPVVAFPYYEGVFGQQRRGVA